MCAKRITVIIVNYNVKEFISDLLDSLNKAAGEIELEVFIVDNASSDGSAEFLKKNFPWVHLIENSENLGFGKANNQAISKATGDYTLLINPDTVVREDTLKVMYDHMEGNPETGAAGCKLLNPDGTFAPESRRSVPTPATALWKLTGLSTLFPNSKTFGKYHLGWMSENEKASVPVLSGSFMFFRTSVLQEIGGFDERFFMYAEDIDICYRTTNAGYRIDYVPDTSVTHYKGESTKKENLDYIVIFNKAMYQFFDKHYSSHYTSLFKAIIAVFLFVRVVIGYMGSILKKSARLIQDLLLINVILLMFMAIRMDQPLRYTIENFDYRFLVVNLLLTGAYILMSVYYDLYNRNKKSYIDTAKAVVLSFFIVVGITFFFREFAFSRWIIIMATLASLAAIGLLRLFQWNTKAETDFKKVLISGYDQHTAKLIAELKKQKRFEICGILLQPDQPWKEEINGVPVIGRINYTAKLAAYHNVDQIYYTVPALDMDTILEQMVAIHDTNIGEYIVPPSIQYAIGRSRVRFLGKVPVLEKELAYNIRWNRFLKRLTDLFISVPLLILAFPFWYPGFLINRRNRSRHTFYGENNIPFKVSLIEPYEQHRFLNRYILMWYVMIGKFSLVGAPLSHNDNGLNTNYKPGLCGVKQLAGLDSDSAEQQEIDYLQNYNIWTDLYIIFQTIRSKKSTIGRYLNRKSITAK